MPFDGTPTETTAPAAAPARVPLAKLRDITVDWQDAAIREGDYKEAAIVSGLYVILSVLIEKFGEDVTAPALQG